MDNFKEQRCRLCLSTVKDENFKLIEDDTKSILQVLCLNLGLENTSKYIICNGCSGRIMEAFTFKSMCVYTNNTIIPYVDDAAECSIDIKEIYAKEMGKKHLIPTSEDFKVCRFCMELVRDKFIPAREVAVDTEMYMPEINLSLTADPTLCKQCFDSFVAHSDFIRNCLEVNEKLKSCNDDSNWTVTVDSYVKTEEVDIKYECGKDDEWFKIDSSPEKSVDHEILNEICYCDIKTEDGKREVSFANNANQETEYSQITNDPFSHHLTTPNKAHHTYDSSCKGYIPGIEIFECDACDYKTKRKSDLKKHQLTHKDFTETELFECDACDYKTKRKGNLKIHQWIHNDTEGFKCDACDYSSKLKGNLKRHQLTHRVSKREVLECDKCDFKTRRKGNLKIHQWKHRDVPKPEMFECGLCDYKTKRNGDLKKHQVTHQDISEMEGFVCDTCGHKIKHKKNLKLHLLTHRDISETRAFGCDECVYKTKRKSDLKIHQLMHKDGSEFGCDSCDFKTKYKKSLKKHLTTHRAT